MLNLSYTIQVVKPNVVPNFKILGAAVPDKSLKISPRNENPMFIRNFKILGEVALEKSLMKYFIGEKEKMTNKGNDKHEDADSFLHDTRDCAQCVYQISKF